ncbi:MAG: Unknown protein [uncultured Thiotrichaceae bacterium]|uniref:pectate lyase n=1 Tax=uncultured Thiotrichaceae bacterium TaxID=298394 RepID=A0A6S6UH87_9GAMM|nr:MAG: Unknown protein [uncultured Thiotrichaceae bacterium]
MNRMISFSSSIVLLCLIFFSHVVYAQNPSTQAYENLLQHREGFGRNVTGGAGGKLIVLDSLDYEKFKQAVESDAPTWIRFKEGLKGSIEVKGHLYIGSHTTIDGRGADITLTSPGDCDEIRFWKLNKDWKKIPEKRNLIVHNIKIHKVGTGDDCGQGLGIAWGAKDVWVDHVTFSWNGDESFSVGKGASDITLSWNKFTDTNKAILLSWDGPKDEEIDRNMRVTIHHNYFLRVKGRSPQARSGKVHFYNNYLTHWGWLAVRMAQGGKLVSENNVFGMGRSSSSPPAFKSLPNEYSPKRGYISSRNDVFLDKKKSKQVKGELVSIEQTFDPRSFYDYQLFTPSLKLVNILQKKAGWSPNPQW